MKKKKTIYFDVFLNYFFRIQNKKIFGRQKG